MRTRSATIAVLAIGTLAASGFAAPAKASAVAPAPATPTASAATSSDVRPSGAVFALTNDPTGNAVAAYRRSPDGSLALVGAYPTGGFGASLGGAVVDRTASQGALAADRRYHWLLAVNPGSNTLTVFSVAGTRLHRVQVVPTHGSFPNSIAVSPRGDRVFVLNAREGGSLQGYLLRRGRLLTVPSWHRSLGLDTAQGTPAEFTHSPGQIAFTPDGRHLIVTTKASTNSLLVWNLGSNGHLAATPVVHTEAGSVPFSVAFDAAHRLDVVKVGSGSVATYRVQADGQLVSLGATATGGAAVCWISVHRTLAVASNTGSGTLTSLRSRAGAPQLLPTVAAGPAPVDSAFTPDGRFFYVQTGATNTIVSYRVAGGGVLTRIDSDTQPGPNGSEGIVAW